MTCFWVIFGGKKGVIFGVFWGIQELPGKYRKQAKNGQKSVIFTYGKHEKLGAFSVVGKFARKTAFLVIFGISIWIIHGSENIFSQNGVFGVVRDFTYFGGKTIQFRP